MKLCNLAQKEISIVEMSKIKGEGVNCSGASCGSNASLSVDNALNIMRRLNDVVLQKVEPIIAPVTLNDPVSIIIK